MSYDDPDMALMEKAWQRLEDYYGGIGLNWPMTGRIDNWTDVDDFMKRVSDGIYPCPETMAAIYSGFKRYMNARGGISLDEAFFGVPYKQRDSYAYKHYKERQYLHFHESYVMIFRRLLPEQFGTVKLSLEDLAGYYLEGEKANVASFLKAYDRWKKEHYKEYELLRKNLEENES